MDAIVQTVSELAGAAHTKRRRCARALRVLAAVEAIAGVVENRAAGQDEGLADALLLDA